MNEQESFKIVYQKYIISTLNEYINNIEYDHKKYLFHKIERIKLDMP